MSLLVKKWKHGNKKTGLPSSFSLSLSNLSRKKKKDCAHFPILNRIYICIRQRWRQNLDFVYCYYFFTYIIISNLSGKSLFNLSYFECYFSMNFRYVVRFEGLPLFLKKADKLNDMQSFDCFIVMNSMY